DALQREAVYHEGQEKAHRVWAKNTNGVYDALKAEWHKERAQQIRAALAQQQSAQGSPKRRPYNTSGSLSEYGVFPECDAAPVAAQAQPDAGLDVEAVLRRFLTGDGVIAECDKIGRAHV